MGQYYKDQKIGTCESMYYLRLETAKELAARGEHDDDRIPFKEYLEDNVTKFRFPFPDEDDRAKAIGIMTDQKYDRTFNLPVGEVEANHSRITFHNTHLNGGYGINIFLPCPYSKEFKDQGIKTSIGGPGEQFLGVRFQAIRDGKEKTIFQCARCGQLQRFDDEDVKKIKERSKEYFELYNKKDTMSEYKYAMEVINRIK